MRVLLPVGYRVHSDRRYPVLYLLHGADSDYRAWTRYGDAERLTTRAALIVVMPDGGADGWYTDWYAGDRTVQPRWETYHIDELIPWADATFRTIPARRGRAIAGLSMAVDGREVAMRWTAVRPRGVAAEVRPSLVTPAEGATVSGMIAPALRPVAAWRHRDARDGFEVLFVHEHPPGLRLQGHTVAVEAGQVWAVTYDIRVDASWVTQWACVASRSASGRREVELRPDGSGGWIVGGTPLPDLRGCVDVDLEASAVTNALPVHRLRLDVGQAAEAPAVYVRAADLAIERLEQRYLRLPDRGSGERYDYAAPRFDYAGQLTYDDAGLLLDYPGLAERVL